MLAELGSFLAGLHWLIHFIILAGMLVVIWLAIRPFGKLRPYSGQLMVLGAIFWMGLLFFVISYSFPVPRFGGGVTEAGTIPRVWFYVLVPATLIALIQIIRGKDDPDPKWGNVKLVAIIFATLVISVGLFNIIGYYISSAIFIVVTMWMLGSRSKIELIAVPAGWIIFSYFIFARLLYVRLPVGSIISGFLS